LDKGFEIWGNGGTLDRSTTFKLGAHSRTAVYLSSYFPDLESRLEGNLRVKSDKALQGVLDKLFGHIEDPKKFDAKQFAAELKAFQAGFK